LRNSTDYRRTIQVFSFSNNETPCKQTISLRKNIWLINKKAPQNSFTKKPRFKESSLHNIEVSCKQKPSQSEGIENNRMELHCREPPLKASTPENLPSCDMKLSASKKPLHYRA
jgi:hypothetical protein